MILPVISREPQEVEIRQDYNCPDVDVNDVPDECKPRRADLDVRPESFWDDERDEHDQWCTLMFRLFTNGLLAKRIA